MRYFYFAFLFLISVECFSQPSDFIILKKKGKTIHSYYAGTSIEFITKSGAYRNGLINKIKNDTLYIQEFLVRQIPTTLGTYILDTAGSFRYAYHYNQLHSFGPKKQKFNLKGSGASLIGGGILLILGSSVVYLADRDKFSPELLGAAVALTGLGYLLNHSGSKGIIVGKKGYVIAYMNMTR